MLGCWADRSVLVEDGVLEDDDAEEEEEEEEGAKEDEGGKDIKDVATEEDARKHC